MWEQIRSNQIRAAVLVIGMGASLVSLGYFLGLSLFDSALQGVVIALAVWILMSLLAYFQGDSLLLTVSGARKISYNDHPRLYNIIEEMKIASGLEKIPEVYVIDDPAPNAFATGRGPDRAAIAITTGLMEKLNRDELQGVVGHEIAHIQNRDVLLMTMFSALLGTIVMLAWYWRRVLSFGSTTRPRRSSLPRAGGQAQIIIIVVALILIILAPIVARLIYFAISRKREYLADASSALYTRYPEGLASALEKIASSTRQLEWANQATAPMYIINPLRQPGMTASDLTSTHPPISERIRILRSMAGVWGNYEQAYRQVHGGVEGILPASTPVAAAVAPLITIGQKPKAEEPGEIQRTREMSDMMWRLNDYKPITCDCGTKLRVPPGFREMKIKCPHCGRTHSALAGMEPMAVKLPFREMASMFLRLILSFAFIGVGLWITFTTNVNLVIRIIFGYLNLLVFGVWGVVLLYRSIVWLLTGREPF